RIAWDHYRDYLVPTEILPNGSCPREEARTKSLGYSSMNLDAFSVICRLAQCQGVDLWHFQTKGRGVQQAFLYLIPYLPHPETWHRQQIVPYKAGSYIFPGLAGIGLPSQELRSAYNRLPHTRTPWVQFVDLLVKSTPQQKFSPG
ncbi:MAG: alginate lyase family protein, partial [Bryobacteraceae bacterium]